MFCGFGDKDVIVRLEAGDIFLGGAGQDFVYDNAGTFYGGEGDDGSLTSNIGNTGTFDGGDGDIDWVEDNIGGCLINVEFVLGGTGSSC